MVPFTKEMRDIGGKRGQQVRLLRMTAWVRQERAIFLSAVNRQEVFWMVADAGRSVGAPGRRLSGNRGR
jgi:hypothetical protein